HVIGVAQLAKHIAQLGVGIESERILALRTVKLHAGDLALDPPEEMLGLQGRHLCHSRSSQLLRKTLSIEVSRWASPLETPASSSSTQRSWAAAIFLNEAWPVRVSRTIEVRRSPLRRARCTSPSVTRRSMMP